MFRRSTFWTAFVAVLAGLVGCGAKGPSIKTVPVGGTVTHNSQPVEGAAVTFHPVDPRSGKSAIGVTDAQGKFHLETPLGGVKKAPGALLGDYVVAISKDQYADTSTDPMGGAMQKPGGMGEMDATKMQAAQGAIGEAMAAGSAGKPMQGQADDSKTALLPAKYADKQTSGLSATVPQGGKEDFTFDLKDE